MSYQPRWAGGKETGRADRDCAGRYEAIRGELAARRLHGMRVLDLGAYAGYFALRLAADFAAHVVAVDDYPTLPRSVAGDPRITAIPDRLTPTEVRALGRFDVALCLSVLHHIRQWPDMLVALRETAPVLFVETAVAEERLPLAVAHSPDIEAAVAALGGRTIVTTPGYRSHHLRPLRVIG